MFTLYLILVILNRSLYLAGELVGHRINYVIMQLLLAVGQLLFVGAFVGRSENKWHINITSILISIGLIALSWYFLDQSPYVKFILARGNLSLFLFVVFLMTIHYDGLDWFNSGCLLYFLSLWLSFCFVGGGPGWLLFKRTTTSYNILSDFFNILLLVSGLMWLKGERQCRIKRNLMTSQ